MGSLYSLTALVSIPLVSEGSLESRPGDPRSAGGKVLELRVAAAAPESRPAPKPAIKVNNNAAGRYSMTPERKALLHTIRYAEGTWAGGSDDGYRILYGGGRFSRLDRHPEIIVRRRYTSAAAGAYQFLPETWKEAAQKLRLSDFGPTSQDQAALYLVEKRGALGRFEREGLSSEVLALLSMEWASLPASHGGSYYGQPVKCGEELRRFYTAQLAQQRVIAAGRNQPRVSGPWRRIGIPGA
jgi:lysozyme